MSTLLTTRRSAEQQTNTRQFPVSSLLDRAGMASGIAFVVLMFTTSGMVTNPPAEGHYQLMADFYRQQEASFLKVAHLHTIALIFLVIFVGTLSSLVRRADKSNGWLPGVIMSSGLAAALMMILSQACQAATALMAGRKANAELIRAMDEISHIIAHLFGVPLGAFLLTASAGILIYRVAPRWLSILSIISGATLVSAAGTFNSANLLHGIGVLALLLFLLWTLLISIILLWRSRKASKC